MMNIGIAVFALRLTGLTFGLGSLFISALASAEDVTADSQDTVKVGVYAQHSGGKITYNYRVINNTQQTIAKVVIGLDNQNDGNQANDTYELYELPSGWNAKFGIPAASSNSPTGWRTSMVVPEEGGIMHAISWEPMNDKTPKLLPGQAMTRMSINLDKADANYMASHALVTFSEGNPASLNVLLDRLDSTPPVFSVILSPDTIMPQDDKFVAVKAAFTTKDDFDRFPEIKLESVISSEPSDGDDVRDASIGLDDRYLKLRAHSTSPTGRNYTVTYSATDASGNQSIASATVTVVGGEPIITTPLK
jgi:hypothetical protein